MKKFETHGLLFYELCNQYADRLEEERKLVEKSFANFEANQIEEIQLYIKTEDAKFDQKVETLNAEFNNDISITFGEENYQFLCGWSNKNLNDHPKKTLQKALDEWVRSVNQCLILT